MPHSPLLPRAAALLSLMLMPATASDAAPTATLSDVGLQLGDLAGDEVYVMGINRLARGPYRVVRTVFERVPIVDDGAVWEAPDGVSDQSLWVAVDESVLPTVVAPTDLELAIVPLDLGTDLIAGPSGNPDTLRLPISSVVGWVVRPGVGAWMIRAEDGGPFDSDLQNDGALSVHLPLAEPWDVETPPFDYVKPSDVLVGINSRTLAFYAVTVAD